MDGQSREGTPEVIRVSIDVDTTEAEHLLGELLAYCREHAAVEQLRQIFGACARSRQIVPGMFDLVAIGERTGPSVIRCELRPSNRLEAFLAGCRVAEAWRPPGP